MLQKSVFSNQRYSIYKYNKSKLVTDKPQMIK